jgi:hypothetical protein
MDLDLLSSNMVKEKNRIYSTLFPNTKLLNQIQPFFIIGKWQTKIFLSSPFSNDFLFFLLASKDQNMNKMKFYDKISNI